jgi:hypothetical protein
MGMKVTGPIPRIDGGTDGEKDADQLLADRTGIRGSCGTRATKRSRGRTAVLRR